MANAYQNQLAALLQNPGSFSASPGYQFIRDQALEATQRQNASQRGSFNALAALQDRAAGLASTAYGDQRDFLGRMTGQEQQYELGSEANRLTGLRDANSYSLGREQNAITGQRNAWDYDLGKGGLENSRRSADQQFGLGMYRAGNDYALGQGQNANTAQNNWWNYRLGQGRNATDRYNAGTNRGSAQSQDYYRGQASDQEWQRLNPPRRYF